MSNSEGSFWASLPGILTGIAAVVTAIGGIYLGVTQINNSAAPKEKLASPSTQPPQQSTQTLQSAAQSSRAFESVPSKSYETWPSIAYEAFTNTSISWTRGRYSDKNVTTDLQDIGGKYRWELDFFFLEPWQRFIEAPYGPEIDFYVAVDVRLVETTLNGTNLSLLFGRASQKDYGFAITTSGTGEFLGLSRFDGTNNSMIIDWTPIVVDLRKTNRLGVLVENQTIKIFLNSSLVGQYRDITFSGGKVGLAVEGSSKGRAVVEFDNFEYRRKPH